MTRSTKSGSGLQQNAGTIRRRGPVSAVVQPANPARPTPYAPRPDLLPAKMRAAIAQPRATPLPRAPAAAQRQIVVQAMNPLNVGVRFDTSKGSHYTVYRGDGIDREKYYEGGKVTENPTKNIFYGDHATTEKCLEYRDYCTRYKLFPKQFGTWTIAFYDGRSEVLYSGTLQSWPKVGLYPIDMVLKLNNEGAMPDDRFHVGDQIVKL